MKTILVSNIDNVNDAAISNQCNACTLNIQIINDVDIQPENSTIIQYSILILREA